MIYRLVAIFVVLSVLNFVEAQQPSGKSLPEGVTVHRDLSYVEKGHERQKLDLYLPTADSPTALIVWVHGGAWLAGDKAGTPALALTKEGYAVASLNYRLSQHALFPAQIEDCKAALRWLRANAKNYNIDTNRVGVWGSSAGGHLVALLGTSGNVKELEGNLGNDAQSSRVQCVVDFYGPTDFTKMGGKHNAPKSPESRLIGGPVLQNKNRAAEANPITYVTKDDPPFLIVHGDKDPTVPFGQSKLLHEALEKGGVSSKLITIEGGGHGGNGFQSDELRKTITAFFDKHLGVRKFNSSERPAERQSRQPGPARPDSETNSPEGVTYTFTPTHLPQGIAKAEFALWLPESLPVDRPVRGVLGTSDYEGGRRLHDDPAWRALACELSFVCLRYRVEMRTDFHKVCKDERAEKLLHEALADFARQCERPEIEHSGLVLTGLSQAGWQATALAARMSRRVIATVAFHEATPIHQHDLCQVEAGHTVPQLHVMGGRCFLTPYIQPWALEARQQGALWTTCLQANTPHAKVGDLSFVRLWLKEVVALRVPLEVINGKTVELLTAKEDVGRFGILKLRVDGNFTPYEKLANDSGAPGTGRGKQVTAPKRTTVQSAELTEDNRRQAVWLPSETAADAWLRYHK